MPFGIENEEELQQAMHIANCIQGAIPENSHGGQVMFAMALLIATGAKANMAPEEIEGVIEHVVEVMDAVFTGKIVTRFVIPN